ncbi:MAG TPA: 50S ribosomal protein L9 [Gaiellaceae bacterium]
MQVILLSDVEKLGLRGDVVDVARGYARNFLLPRKLAQVATKGALEDVRRREEDRARHEAKSAEQAEAIATELRKTVLRFEVQSGPTGTLFGSVTPSEIADEIWRVKKIRVDRRKVGVDPIKRIGRYEIPIEVFQDVSVEVKTLVVPEGGELPPEEELAAMAAAEEAAKAPAEPAPEIDYDELDEIDAEAEAAGIDAAIAAVEADDGEPAAAAEPEPEPQPEEE